MVLRLILSAVLLACTGCLSAYAPPAPVAPLLRTSGTLTAGGLVSTLPHALSATGYVAAAPTSSLRVYGSGSFTRARLPARADYEEAEDAPAYNHGAQGELGAGYAHVGRYLIMDVLGGAGAGRIRAQECRFGVGEWDYGPCRQSEAHFGTMFGQFDVGGGNRFVTVGLGLRASLTHQVFTQLHDAPTSRRIWMPGLEPFTVLRAGLPWLKAELGLNWPVLVRTSSATPFAQLPRVVLGLQATFDHLWP